MPPVLQAAQPSSNLRPSQRLSAIASGPRSLSYEKPHSTRSTVPAPVSSTPNTPIDPAAAPPSPRASTAEPRWGLDRRQWLKYAAVTGLAPLSTAVWSKDSAAPASSVVPAATGDVVLTVSGQVGRRNSATGMDFDMAMLAALPQWSVETTTPWSPERHRFSGPLLRTVLEYCEAHGSNLHASALNDYDVDIPVADAYEGDVIVARLRDGQPMRVRDRGPLFIIYPFDQNARWRRPTVISRAIWQLRRIEVR